MMPRDVTTRWNSTYDMLEFAVEHRQALDSITGNWEMKLRQYELTEEDWMIATKVRDVLKVRYHLLLIVQIIKAIWAFMVSLLVQFGCSSVR